MAAQPTPPKKPGDSIQAFAGELPPAAPAAPSVAQILRNAEATTKNNPKLIIPEIEDMVEELAGAQPTVEYRVINDTKDEIFHIDLPRSALDNDALAGVGLSKEELRGYLLPEEPDNKAGNPDDLELDIAPLVTLAIPAYRIRSALEKFNTPQEKPAPIPVPAAPALQPAQEWQVPMFIMDKLIAGWKKAGKISDPVTFDNLAQAICTYAKAVETKDSRWAGLKNITITRDGNASHVIFHNVSKNTDPAVLFRNLSEGVIVLDPQSKTGGKSAPVAPKPVVPIPAAVVPVAPKPVVPIPTAVVPVVAAAKPSAGYTREKFVALLKRTFTPPAYSCAENGADFVVNYVGADNPIIKIRMRNFLPIFGFSEAQIKQIAFSEPGGDIKLQITIPEEVARESFDAAQAKVAPIVKKDAPPAKSHAAKHAGKPPGGGHGKGH